MGKSKQKRTGRSGRPPAKATAQPKLTGRGGAGRGQGRPKATRPTDSGVASRVLAKVKAEQTWLSLVAIEKRRLGIGADGKLIDNNVIHNVSIQPLVHLLHYLEDRAHGRTVQQIRMANPEGDKFRVEVDIVSAREKLMGALLD